MVKWKPVVSHGFVPDEPFVPDFDEQARVQTVGLAVDQKNEKDTFIQVRVGLLNDIFGPLFFATFHLVKKASIIRWQVTDVVY